MDGTVASNDCLHRLYNYDFVAIMDLDELLFPAPGFKTLPDILQVSSLKSRSNRLRTFGFSCMVRSDPISCGVTGPLKSRIAQQLP